MKILDQTIRILDDDGALVLATTDANGYRLVSISEGARTQRRAVAMSRFVPGGAQTAATADMQNAIVQWLVGGNTDTQLRTRINTLKAAVDQFRFQLEVTIQAVTEVWDCDCADTAVGDAGAYASYLMADKKQLFTATIPRQPDPLSISGL